MKNKNLFTIFASASVLIMAAMYLLFDSYVADIGKQTMQNWIKSESNLIIEGNLLTSVTKIQHLVRSSDYVKGAVLLDLTSTHQKELVVIGEAIDSNSVNVDGQDKISVGTTGFFKKLVVAKIPHKNNMLLVLSIWSENINRIFFITSALFILLFSSCVALMRKNQIAEFQKREATTKAFAEKAARVAHDIRAPLMVVSSLVESLKSPSEQIKLETAVGKLTEVIDELVDDYEKKATPSKPISQPKCFTFNLGNELKHIINAKEIQYSEVTKIKITGATSFDLISTRLSPLEFNRTLSNIIDNAVDACGGNGLVNLTTSTAVGHIEIKITDNGRGVSPELLQRIGEKGFTYGKPHGSGLGLYYAKKSIEDIGGKFIFDSKENFGSTVTLSFPVFYFTTGETTNLHLPKDAPIYVLDDDKNVLWGWETLFKNSDVNAFYFSSPLELMRELAGKNHKNIFLLTDFELQKNLNGLDVVEQAGLSYRSVLVTGRDFDKDVQARARILGVPVLGKDRLPLLKVVTV